MSRFKKEAITVAVTLFCCLNIAYCDDIPKNHYKYIDLAKANVPASQCFGEKVGGFTTLGSKVKDGVLMAANIPFQLSKTSPKAIVTGLEETKSVSVKINTPAYRVYLLASTRVTDRGDIWGGYNDDSHFHVRLHYRDGGIETVIPKLLPSNEYLAADWLNEKDAGRAALTLEENDATKHLFVYGIDPGWAKLIDTIELIDLKPRFALALFAITLDTRPAITRQPEVITPDPVSIEDYKIVIPRMKKQGEVLRGSSSLMKFSFDLSEGIALRDISAPGKIKDIIQGSSCPLFKVKIGDEILSAEDFRVVDVKISDEGGTSQAVVCLDPINSDIPINLKLNLRAENPGTLRMRLIVEARRVCEVQLTFPIVQGIRLGGKANDDQYFFPIKGGIVHDRAVSLNNLYCGFGAWVQFMDIFDKKAGGGLTLRVEDNENISKRFELRKTTASDPFTFNRFKDFSNYTLPIEVDDDVLAMAIHYQSWKMEEGEHLEFPQTALEVHQGDWRQAANLYLAWLKTWYRPDERTPWVKNLFISRAFHPRHYIENGVYTTKYLSGYEDMIDLYGWWVGGGLRGDYEYKPEMNDPQALRRFIEELQAHGIKVSNYAEGFLAQEGSKIGQQKGAEWGIMHRDGSYSADFGKYNMCQASQGWQDYISGVAERLVRDLNLDSQYLDCSARVFRDCYNPAHNHKTPGVFLSGAGKLFQKAHSRVRENAKPLTAVWSEEPGTDVTTQWVDLAYSYVLWYYLGEMPRELNPQGINLFRFFIPDFKLIEIVGENNEEGSRLAFFNATGIHGFFDSPFLQGFWKRLARAFHQHEDAFTSANVEPLVPTFREGLFANGFYGRYEKVYTLFNSNYRSISGILIELPLIEAAVYTDIFSGKEYDIKRKGQKVIVSGNIGPRDVTAIVIKLPD